MKTECKICGATFEREKKRGRPPVKCPDCRGTKPQVVEVKPVEVKQPKGKNGLYSVAKLVEYIDDHPEFLYLGSREKGKIIQELTA